MRRIALACCCLFLLLSSSSFAFTDGSRPHRATSPDGKVVLSFWLEKEQLYYQVDYKGQSVIEASPMTLTIDGRQIGLHSFDTIFQRISDYDFPTRGFHSKAQMHRNGLGASWDRGKFELRHR